MAKLEKVLEGDFDVIIQNIEKGILSGSFSATLENSSDFQSEHSRCSVRVFERYSAIGSNRVSLCITLFQEKGGAISLSAITSGGSQAKFFKINTWGEEAFLQKLIEILS